MTETMVVRKVTDDRNTVLTRNPWNHKGRRMRRREIQVLTTSHPSAVSLYDCL